MYKITNYVTTNGSNAIIKIHNNKKNVNHDYN